MENKYGVFKRITTLTSDSQICYGGPYSRQRAEKQAKRLANSANFIHPDELQCRRFEIGPFMPGHVHLWFDGLKRFFDGNNVKIVR